MKYLSLSQLGEHKCTGEETCSKLKFLVALEGRIAPRRHPMCTRDRIPLEAKYKYQGMS